MSSPEKVVLLSVEAPYAWGPFSLHVTYTCWVAAHFTMTEFPHMTRVLAPDLSPHIISNTCLPWT